MSQSARTDGARAEVIATLESVDMVMLFNEETPLALVQALRPDLLFNGSDYTVETLFGHVIVLGYGGQVEALELMKGDSTTRIVEHSRVVIGG